MAKDFSASADDVAYTQYVMGVQDSSNNAFNYLIAGGSDFTNQSGLMIKSDTTKGKGTHLYQDSNDNAYFDLRTTAGGAKNIALRIQDDQNPSTYYSALTLTDDNKSSTSVYGATVGGRVKASQFYVGESDTRAPVNAGVYVGQDASNVAYLNINKGSGTGGFAFNTYNADGTLAKNNLNLAADGTVQAVAYSQTTDALDTETYAIAAFDASGNLVRNYQQNARLRSLANRVTTLETEMIQTLPSKVNQIIGRINGLKFFNNDIEKLTISPAPTPYP